MPTYSAGELDVRVSIKFWAAVLFFFVLLPCFRSARALGIAVDPERATDLIASWGFRYQVRAKGGTWRRLA